MAYDRSKGRLHEKDHPHKHEKDFRVAARRNKLLGLWAAELMNIGGPQAESYAKEVVSSDLEEPGDEDVIRKVLADFQRHGVTVTRETVRKKMEEMLVEARHQLEAHYPAEEDEAARRIRFASGLGRQARRVGAGLITRRDI